MTKYSPRRLVIILPYLKARGTEKQALMLSQGLVALGWDVSLVVVMGWGEPWLYDAFHSAGIKVFNLGRPWPRERKGVSWLRLPHLVRHLLLHRPDVVMSRALLANRLSGVAAMITLLPFLATYSGGIADAVEASHRLGLSSWLIRSQEWIWRMLQGWPSKLVTVSSQSAEHLHRRFPHSVRWVMPIQNGVVCSKSEGDVRKKRDCVELKPIRLLFVGSIEFDRKGLDVLIDAVEILAKDSVLFCLQIVGDGPDSSRLKSLIVAKGLQEFVELTGETNRPADLMRDADLLLLPSRREGLPNVMLEAMSCGLCVIASACPVGPSEVIRHGESGWLVPVGDAASLAEAVSTLAGDSVLRERLAFAGYTHVATHCSEKVMTERYHSTLSSLIPSGGTSLI